MIGSEAGIVKDFQSTPVVWGEKVAAKVNLKRLSAFVVDSNTEHVQISNGLVSKSDQELFGF